MPGTDETPYATLAILSGVGFVYCRMGCVLDVFKGISVWWIIRLGSYTRWTGLLERRNVPNSDALSNNVNK